jgi:hypothetical protein
MLEVEIDRSTISGACSHIPKERSIDYDVPIMLLAKLLRRHLLLQEWFEH